MSFGRSLDRFTYSKLVFACCTIGCLSAADWRPIDPAHLALKEPAVEKDADAEVLLWDVRVEDGTQGDSLQTRFTHYVRIKIFTEKGSKDQATIDIPYFNKTNIADIAGRTIRPDGSVVELKKDAVFERTVVKFGGLRVKAKSFAMPAVEPGVIMEYRYREIRDNQLANYVRLPFQRELPVHSVRYHLKPLQLAWLPYGMQSMAFHCPSTPFQREPDGFYVTGLQNVPAFRPEPDMPPEDQVRPWMLIYYAEDGKIANPEKFWRDLAKQHQQVFKTNTKINDDVRRASEEAIGDAKTDEQKLERLFLYTRSHVKNVFSENQGVTAQQRDAFKPNKSPSDTLKQKLGTGSDLNYLFSAMAMAAGFDVRLSSTADRSDTFFDQGFPSAYFLRARNIAVKVGDEWRFYDPAATYIASGSLRWQEEFQQALLSDPKEALWVKTPLSAPEKSLRKGYAILKLNEDGTLEGRVKVTYSGHAGVDQKRNYDDESPEQQIESFKTLLQNRLGGAEISDVKLENVSDPEKPFSYFYRLRIPGYAQRTGKRLFVQPAFFQFNFATRFPNSARKHDIYFHYPWAEEDEVTIELPEGYTLDHATAPQSFGLGKVGDYKVSLGISKDTNALVYRRSLVFGRQGSLIFPAQNYAALKQAFDAIHEQDSHAVTLKAGGSASNGGTQ